MASTERLAGSRGLFLWRAPCIEPADAGFRGRRTTLHWVDELSYLQHKVPQRQGVSCFVSFWLSSCPNLSPSLSLTRGSKHGLTGTTTRCRSASPGQAGGCKQSGGEAEFSLTWKRTTSRIGSLSGVRKCARNEGWSSIFATKRKIPGSFAYLNPLRNTNRQSGEQIGGVPRASQRKCHGLNVFFRRGAAL